MTSLTRSIIIYLTQKCKLRKDKMEGTNGKSLKFKKKGGREKKESEKMKENEVKESVSLTALKNNFT